ncbi:hypothetical protein KAR91_64740 [Candidatus Pacearchaeota archaeon]|nr:hypothetical protein [Candidatus Pacearchaeota archaeon]
MKKIIYLLLIPVLLIGCEKQKELEPKEFDIVNIELYGAFTGWYDFIGNIDYTINVKVNGLDHYINIVQILDGGFVGTIYSKQLKLNETDQLEISILNNNYPDIAYVYLKLYTHINRPKIIEFEEFKEVRILIEDNYFRDIGIE